MANYSDLLLVGLKTDGTPDTNFGNAGALDLSPPSGSGLFVHYGPDAGRAALLGCLCDTTDTDGVAALASTGLRRVLRIG